MTPKNQTEQSHFGTAVVIGGSVAGICMARVLSEHFERVLVLDRDHLSTEPQPHAGVPQSHQVHILLMRGQQILTELFPHLWSDLQRAGATEFDLLGDTRLCLYGEWLNPLPSDQIMVGCSRVLLESTLRRHLLRIPNVVVRGGVEVTGLLGGAENRAVTGVCVKRRGTSAAGSQMGSDTEPAEERIEAAFVVDASGRNSRAPAWLNELGYDTPEETVVNSFLGYASRRYHPAPDTQPDWRMMLVGSYAPNVPRGGLIYPEENGTWMVMLNGAMKEYPPTDDAGFEEFARSVNPDFYAALQGATPLSKARGYRGTENRQRHYEALTRWPARFVVVGDALCAFNPVYGQGMTVAAITAQALGEHLAESLGDLDAVAAPFQRRVAQIIAPVWRMATGIDYSWPTTEGGKRSALVRFSHWYNRKLSGALAHDPVLYRTFIDVLQMTRPSAALLAPGVVLRVLRHYVGRSLRRGGAARQTPASTDAPAH